MSDIVKERYYDIAQVCLNGHVVQRQKPLQKTLEQVSLRSRRSRTTIFRSDVGVRRVTYRVILAAYPRRMETLALRSGDQLRCPHCRRWHPLVFRADVTSTPYANDMLFWQCGKGSGFYYAGQLGGTSRFETRRPRRSPCRLPLPDAEEA
jgi:hypothetical protein